MWQFDGVETAENLRARAQVFRQARLQRVLVRTADQRELIVIDRAAREIRQWITTETNPAG